MQLFWNSVLIKRKLIPERKSFSNRLDLTVRVSIAHAIRKYRPPLLGCQMVLPVVHFYPNRRFGIAYKCNFDIWMSMHLTRTLMLWQCTHKRK